VRTLPAHWDNTTALHQIGGISVLLFLVLLRADSKYGTPPTQKYESLDRGAAGRYYIG
jgi:hypothetical protein